MSNRSIEKIYNKALKLLERRLHTRLELERKLLLRGYEGLLVAEVIERLTELDYLNDQRFAEIFLDNLIKYKTFGFYGLKAKLLQRGIASNEAEQLLKDKLPFEKETEIAQRVLDKKREKNPVKLAQALSRKGFRTQVIKQILGFTNY
ncbi:MAG: RecX family transcriptional regulator [Candidatus Doudnabacteria bacterium]|nr:RecX family transcriptional regulator [Candidatus Doudnabacteria bacterium]